MTDDPDRHLAALRALHTVTTALHSCSDLSTTMDLVAHGLVTAVGFGVAAVNLRMPDDHLEVVTVAGDDDARACLLGKRDSMSAWLALLDLSEQWATKLCFLDHSRRGEHLTDFWTPDIPVPDEDDAWHPEDSLFAPLMTPAGDWLGVVSVDLPEGGRRPQPWQLEVLEMFVDSAAIAVMNARLLEALTHAATHDALTGLPNRTLLIERAQSHTRPDYAVLVIDLDAFKAVNDNFGHTAGDDVLVAVASRMRRAVRDTDMIARTGGDEFVVLLAEADGQLVGRVRARLEDSLREPVSGPWGSHRVTASIGLALPRAGADFARLLASADADMYRNKLGDLGRGAHSQPA